MRHDSELELALLKEKQEVREVRGYTARIRQATRELPTLTRLQGWNADSDKQQLREVLQEIIGSANEIGNILGVDL